VPASKKQPKLHANEFKEDRKTVSWPFRFAIRLF